MTDELKNYGMSRQIIHKAGACLLDTHAVQIREKSNYNDIVTSCDRAVQEYLMERLGKLYPDAAFLCEESDVQDVSGDHMFIIDPIDGTTNFVRGYGQSAISVAYADRREVLWGMVYNPYTEEFYEARKGEGALLNGETIRVSGHSLHDSLVSFGTSPYNREQWERSFQIAEDLMGCCMDIRRSGSAALDLCYVAAGRCGLYFERVLSPWDFAAGLRIVKESGGMVTDFRGNEPDVTSKSGIVAGNRTAWKEFLERYGEDRSRGE